MPSFSPTLEHAIHSSLALANDRQHEFATLEHLLLALLDEPDAERVLLACDVSVPSLRETLIEYLDEDLTSLITEIDGAEAARFTAHIAQVLSDLKRLIL